MGYHLSPFRLPWVEIKYRRFAKLLLDWWNANGTLISQKKLLGSSTWISRPNSSGSLWVFPKIGVPQNGWFVMENPTKMEDLGVHLFLETPLSETEWFIFSQCQDATAHCGCDDWDGEASEILNPWDNKKESKHLNEALVWARCLKHSSSSKTKSCSSCLKQNHLLKIIVSSSLWMVSPNELNQCYHFWYKPFPCFQQPSVRHGVTNDRWWSRW